MSSRSVASVAPWLRRVQAELQRSRTYPGGHRAPVIASPPTVTYGRGGGIASVTVAAGGAGYAVNDVITLTGGVPVIDGQLKVTAVAAGVITGVAVHRPGVYTTNPVNPVAQGSTTGVGAGATFTLTMNAGVGSGLTGTTTNIGPTSSRIGFYGTGPTGSGGNSVILGGVDVQCYFEFTTDADVLDLRITAYNTKFQVFIEGQRLAASTYSTDSSGALYVMTITQPDRTPRTYRIVGVNLLFAGIAVSTASTVWRPNEPRRPAGWVLGDSYTAGSGGVDGTASANNIMGEIAGIDLICNGVGGAGWLSSAAGTPTARVTGTMPSLSATPEVVFLDLGYNDGASAPDTVAIGASIDSTIAAVRTYAPSARIILFGPATPLGDTANLTSVRTVVQARAAANGCDFVDVQGWVTSSNKGVYTSGDNVHPNEAGHIYLGERRARAVNSLLLS